MSARIVLPVFANPTDNTGSMLDLCTEPMEGICGPVTCSTTGVFHLQWSFKTIKPSYVFPNGSFHYIGMFVVPILMGQWVASIVLFLSGPGLALFFTGIKAGEWSAIWCFFSIAESLCTLIAQCVILRMTAGKSNDAERKPVIEDERKAGELISKKTQ
jgi:hypothetical protein